MWWWFAAACAYVTRDEVDAALDADGDGWAVGDDCDPDNPDVYPGAPDLRGDGCDADCGDESDIDGDDWPDVADCGPNDPRAYPCSPHEVDGDGVDLDCDGLDGRRSDRCEGADPGFEDAPENPCSA
jgi:hypothetical protein